MKNRKFLILVERIVVIDDIVSLSNAFNRLSKSKGDRETIEYLGLETKVKLEFLRHYSDGTVVSSSVDDDNDVDGGNYFAINDGDLETVVTDEAW